MVDRKIRLFTSRLLGNFNGRRITALSAIRQRIAELFPSTHRTVSGAAIRHRIVEMGGGGVISSGVRVAAKCAAPGPRPEFVVSRLASGFPWKCNRKRWVDRQTGRGSTCLQTSP